MSTSSIPALEFVNTAQPRVYIQFSMVQPGEALVNPNFRGGDSLQNART